MKPYTLLLLAAAALPAQQIKLDLRHLESKASHTVDVSLNGATLQFAAKFLSGKDPDEAKVKQLVSGIEGIYIRSFEFKREGEWSPSDLESVRNQLRAPDWSRMIGVKSTEDGENAEVFIRMDAATKKVTGVAILVTDPKEFTVVHIAGPIDIENLADLGGHFNLPKLNIPRSKKLE